MATRKTVKRRYDTGGVTESDVAAANESEDSIGALNARKKWTDSEEGGPAEEEPASKKESFKEAFARSRASGAKTFEWNGKKYTTEVAAEKKSSASKAEPTKTDSVKAEPAKAAESKPTRVTSFPPDSVAGKIARSQGAVSDFPQEGSPTGAKAARQYKENTESLSRMGNKFLRYMGTQETRDRLKAQGYAKGGAVGNDEASSLKTDQPETSRAGAGRGVVNPAPAKKTEMSAVERAARNEAKAMKEQAATDKAYNEASKDMGFAKGGKVRGWGMARGAKGYKTY